LNLNQFNNDLDQVVERARQAGIYRILVPGIDVETSHKAIELAERYSEIYAAVGIHPNIGSGWQPGAISEIEKLAVHPKVVAIGEIGLDHHWKDTDPELQRQILSSQLDLAERIRKPVILHSRDALFELLPILLDWSGQLAESDSPLAAHPGVLHSFEGSLEQAAIARKAGFYISIAGPVTFPNAAEKHELAKQHPLDNLLIETDAPYLSPQLHRGQRNEPSYVSQVADKIGVLRNLPYEEIVEATSRNASNLFFRSH
jgi:TatD DNase family protein